MRISYWSSDVCSSDLLNPADDLNDANALKQRLTPAFENYRSMYKAYYENFKHPNSPAIRDENPAVILYRSAERRVGDECFITGRSLWSPYPHNTIQRLLIQ